LHSKGALLCKTQKNHEKAPIQRWIFSGSGLVTHSLKPYFIVIWANDISEQKAQVYMHNHDLSHFHLADINMLTGSMPRNIIRMSC